MNRDVDVRLYGAFRQFGAHRTVSVPCEAGTTVAALRSACHSEFAGNDEARALLEVAAFASDDRVLGDADALPASGEMALLPPVCGG